MHSPRLALVPEAARPGKQASRQAQHSFKPPAVQYATNAMHMILAQGVPLLVRLHRAQGWLSPRHWYWEV